jgi:uncharacterized protein (DUF2062 family)
LIYFYISLIVAFGPQGSLLIPVTILYLHRSKKYLKRKLVNPLLGLLTMGLSPTKLAVTVSLGFVVGIMPLVGMATLICTALGYRLRLNIPALLLICYLASPFHLVLYLPFIKLGIWIFGASDFRMSFDQILDLFRQDWLVALNKIWLANMLGVAAWALVTLPLGLLIYFGLKPVLRRVLYRKGQPREQEDVLI